MKARVGKTKRKLTMIDATVYHSVSVSIHYTDGETKASETISLLSSQAIKKY